MTTRRALRIICFAAAVLSMPGGNAAAQNHDAGRSAPGARIPSTVSVVIDGKDGAHVAEVLEALVRLTQTRSVRAGEVLIAGLHVYGPKFSSASSRESGNTALAGQTETLIRGYAAQAKVPEQEVIDAEQVISRLGITHSPAWLVRHRGRDYLFEGFPDISRYFSSSGEFANETW